MIDVQSNANRSFALSLGRAITETPAPQRKAFTEDVSSIEDMLSQMALSAQKEQQALLSAFEQRNKALWNSIEGAIAKAEKEDAERRAALEEQRRKQEEAERKAKEMREAEERKRKQEQEERERKEREEQERAEREEKERQAQAEREKATSGFAPGTSPKEQWEKWTAFMAVSLPFLIPIIHAHQHAGLSHTDIGSRLGKHCLSQSLLHCKACHHAQDRPTHRFSLCDAAQPSSGRYNIAKHQARVSVWRTLRVVLEPFIKSHHQTGRARNDSQSRNLLPARTDGHRSLGKRARTAGEHPNGTSQQKVVLAVRLLSSAGKSDARRTSQTARIHSVRRDRDAVQQSNGRIVCSLRCRLRDVSDDTASGSRGPESCAARFQARFAVATAGRSDAAAVHRVRSDTFIDARDPTSRWCRHASNLRQTDAQTARLPFAAGHSREEGALERRQQSRAGATRNLVRRMGKGQSCRAQRISSRPVAVCNAPTSNQVR